MDGWSEKEKENVGEKVKVVDDRHARSLEPCGDLSLSFFLQTVVQTLPFGEKEQPHSKTKSNNVREIIHSCC